jgi:hypothetical protein
MAKRDRKKMAEALEKRTKESSSRKSGGFVNIFKDDLEDVNFWRVSEGDHTIDVIPYEVGANDPNVEEGEFGYVLEVKVHQGIGAAEGSYICLAENYNKPCPVCEHRRTLKKEGADEDEIKALYPKNRCVYNVVCYDSTKEEEKGVQVWEFSRWFSERLFTKLAKPKRRRGADTSDRIIFAHPINGKSIEFTREGTGQESTSFYGHSFTDRDYEIDDETLDMAHCLDELIDVLPYDELYEIYWGKPNEETKEEPVEEEEKSPRERKTKRKKEPVEEEEGNKCPGGGTFGVDIDKLDQCEECNNTIWKACARASSDKKEEPKEEPKEESKEEPKKATGRRRGRRSK